MMASYELKFDLDNEDDFLFIEDLKEMFDQDVEKIKKYLVKYHLQRRRIKYHNENKPKFETLSKKYQYLRKNKKIIKLSYLCSPVVKKNGETLFVGCSYKSVVKFMKIRAIEIESHNAMLKNKKKPGRASLMNS